MERCPHRNFYSHVYPTVFIRAKRQKQAKISIKGWINKQNMVYPHNRIVFSYKKGWIFPHFMSPFIWKSKIEKSMETEIILWGWGYKDVIVKRCRGFGEGLLEMEPQALHKLGKHPSMSYIHNPPLILFWARVLLLQPQSSWDCSHVWSHLATPSPFIYLFIFLLLFLFFEVMKMF